MVLAEDAMSATQNQITATILSGASLSAAVFLGSGALARIDMPAAWTAATLTFQLSPDGVTYRNLYDASGVEYEVQASAAYSIAMPVADFQGAQYLKVRSGTAGVPVNQGADRLLTLIAQKEAGR
jgi:phosphoglycerol transferase MdoB-like AlkP superfamily enzyme